MHAFGALGDEGLQGSAASERFCDLAAGSFIGAGVSRIFSDANNVMRRVRTLVPKTIETILRFGTEAQEDYCIPRLADGDGACRSDHTDMAQVLTSPCTAFNPETGWLAGDLGVRIKGCYGYLAEYGMEQIWRGARICTIKEGANRIHDRGPATCGVQGGGADPFGTLDREVDDVRISPNSSCGWRSLWQGIRSAEDPATSARRLFGASARLLRAAIRERMRAAADYYRDLARILNSHAYRLDGERRS